MTTDNRIKSINRSSVTDKLDIREFVKTLEDNEMMLYKFSGTAHDKLLKDGKYGKEYTFYGNFAAINYNGEEFKSRRLNVNDTDIGEDIVGAIHVAHSRGDSKAAVRFAYEVWVIKNADNAYGYVYDYRAIKAVNVEGQFEAEMAMLK